MKKFGWLMLAVLILSGCGKNLIEVTIPVDLIDETTQEYLDTEVTDGIYEKAVLNEDGSVTYQMTEEQQMMILDDMALIYPDSIAEMCGEDGYGVISIDAAEDYSSFEVFVSEEYMSASDEIVTENLEYMGRMYSLYSGNGDRDIVITFTKDNSKILKNWPEEQIAYPQEVEGYVEGNEFQGTVLGINEDQIQCAPVGYDKEGIYTDGPFIQFEISEDVACFDLDVTMIYVEIDDEVVPESRDISYTELTWKEARDYMENCSSSVFLWFDEEGRVEKLCFYGDLYLYQ